MTNPNWGHISITMMVPISIILLLYMITFYFYYST